MNLKKHFSLIENFISFFLFKAIDAIVPLIVIPYLIGAVTFDLYGVYAFAFALIFYLQNVIQFGFDLSAGRDVALIRDDKKKLAKVYNNALTAQVYLFLLVAVILTVLILTVPKINEHFIVYAYFGLLLFGELLFPYWFFLGMEKMRFVTIINVVAKSSFAIFCFLFIKEEADYIYISLYHSIGFLIAGVISQIIIVKQFGIWFKFSKFSEVKKTIKGSWSSFLTMISPTIYHNTSIFLVGVFGIPSFVGIMEIASKISGAFGVVNTILTSVLYPFLNRNKDKLVQMRKVFVAFGIMLSLAMYFLSKFLIVLWLKTGEETLEKTLEIVKVVKFLSPSPLLISIVSAFGINGLMILKKDKLFSKIIVAGSITGLLLGLVLIPSLNYIGGAITIVSALLFKAIFTTIYFFKENRKEQLNEI